MGQQEVYEFLKKNKTKWFTSREIADLTKISFGSVVTSLKKLRESNQILFKVIKKTIPPTSFRKLYIYKYKA